MVPNSSDLNPLDYQAGGNAGVLLQAATEAKNGSQVYRCTLADWVCIAEESHRQRCELKDNRN